VKIGIIGTGSVGATIAYSILINGLASRVVLVDKFPEKAEGEAMDLNHCSSFVPPVDIDSEPLEQCRDMDVIILTAGIKRRPGESRTDLIKRNIQIFDAITPILTSNNPEAIFIVVSNPVDLLTYHLVKTSGLPVTRIIGSGTLLDTSRLRHLISETVSVDPRNVHAYIIGEHGSGSVPVWSHTQIGVIPIDDFAKQLKIPFGVKEKQDHFERVLTAGQDVIRRKGATFYGIAQTVVRILTAIARDESSILTLSTGIPGYVDIQDVALSLPVVIGRQGIGRVISPALSQDEFRLFKQAADRFRTIAVDSGLQ
jgi:L-lactate dehydrogenase